MARKQGSRFYSVSGWKKHEFSDMLLLEFPHEHGNRKSRLTLTRQQAQDLKIELQNYLDGI